MNNQPRLAFIILILTGVTFAIAGPSAGYGQAAPQPSLPASASTAPGEEAVVKLPEFNVTGAPLDPYNAAESASAARTASKLLDTPVTIDVITPALIQDINPESLLNVTNYFAGISPGRASGVTGANDRQTFRGFESFGRTMDNFSALNVPNMTSGSNFNPVFMDHAELIMGPDSIISPTGTPGGTLSVISKSPQFTQSTDISGTVGNFNGNMLTVDSTGPLGDGKHMAYRVIASYQDARYYTPGSTILWAGDAEFTYKFSDTAKVTFKYFGTLHRLGGTVCSSDEDGEMVYTPDTVGGVTISTTPQPGFVYNGWNGDASWNFQTYRDNTAESELTAALGERINMRLAAQVYYMNVQSVLGFPNPTISETWNPNTGQEISVTPVNPAAIRELAHIYHVMSRQIQVQNDYAGNFTVGAVHLQPIVGFAYQQGAIPDYWIVNDVNIPVANLAAGYYSPPVPPNSAFNSLAQNKPEFGWTMQTYGYLSAGFLNDHLFATAGAARVWAGVNDYILPALITSSNSGSWPGINAGNPGGVVVDQTFSNTNNSLMPNVQPWHDTYVAGLLGKVLPNVSVYYNFSTNAGIAQNIPEWQAGTQHEFGIKSTFFNNRISVSVDHFEIKENNVSATNPLFILGQSTIPILYTDLTSHGEELNIVGGITKELSVIASYTDQKLRDFAGRRQRNIPDNMANLLLDYHFNKGVLKDSDIFAGVIHQGDVAGETIAGFTTLGVPEQPGFYVPAYNIVNAGAGYKLGNYNFNLNVDNLFNTHAWWEVQARNSLTPYPGINVRLTVTVHIK